MALFQRHQLEQEGDSYNLILYLDPNMTEFADDLGNKDQAAQEKLESSVKSYIKEKFPNLKVTAAKVMLGSMMVASIPLGAMTAQAAEAPTPTAPPAVVQQQVTAAPGQLPDVQGTKFETVVNNLTTMGVIAGKGDGKYHPGDNLSRAEFAKFAVYAAGYATEAESTVSSTTGFSDVSPDYWGAKYIKVAKEHGLMAGIGNNKFNPTGNISYEEVVTVLLRVQGYSDNTLGGTWPSNYVAQATQSGITTNSDFAQGKLANRGNAAVILHNAVFQSSVTYNSTTNKFEPTDQTIFDRVFGNEFTMENGKVVASDQVAVSIANATTSTAKSFRIVFNKPVTKADDATFTITRNGSTITLIPKWSNDKRTVELSSDAKLLAGDYTIRLGGLENIGTAEKTVSVQAEEVTNMDLVGDRLIQKKENGEVVPNEATMTYKVFNQYGDDVTNDPIASKIKWTSSLGVEPTGVGGTLTLTTAGDRALKVGENIVITGIDATSGTVITKTVTVSEMASVNRFELGNIQYPQGVNKILTGEAEAIRIPIKAYDQYGNMITDPTELSPAIQLLSNLPKIDNTTNPFTFARSEDGQGVDIVLNTTGLTSDQKAVLTLVSVTTGTTKNMTFDVVQPSAPASIELESVSKLIASGDTSLVIPLRVVDQFGTELTAAQIGDKATKFNITATGGLDNKLQIATSGANKGKLVLKEGQTIGAAGPSVIIVTVTDTGKSSNISLNIRDAREISDLVAPANVTNNLLQGATYNFGFKFRDQYGEILTNPPQNEDYGYKLKLEKVSGEDNAITFTVGGQTLNKDTTSVTGTDETALSGTKIKAIADPSKTGTYRLVAQLTGANDTVVSQSVLTFTNVEATGSLTYAVGDIPDTIYGGEEATATNFYTVPIKLTAKDAQGKDYIVNPADIISVVSSSSNVVYDPINKTIHGVLNTNDPSTVKATITVNFNTKEAVKSITKDITVSKAALTYETFGFYDTWYVDNEELVTTVKDAPPTTATEVTNVTAKVSGGTATIQGLLTGQDQYGVYKLLTSGDVNSISITNLKGITKAADSAVILTDGTIDITKLTLDPAATDHTARLNITSNTGKVVSINVSLTNAGS